MGSSDRISLTTIIKLPFQHPPALQKQPENPLTYLIPLENQRLFKIRDNPHNPRESAIQTITQLPPLSSPSHPHTPHPRVPATPDRTLRQEYCRCPPSPCRPSDTPPLPTRVHQAGPGRSKIGYAPRQPQRVPVAHG